MSGLKEAHYKIIQNWGLSKQIQLYRHYNSKHAKITLDHHAIFAIAIDKLHKIPLFIYDVIIPCLKAWYVIAATQQKSKNNYFYLRSS